MLQHPIDDSSYQCSMQQSSSRDYSSCTVVIRKREINDQIIEKQSFLIQRMKQDHIFVKRLLESKSNELIKMKNTLDLVQIENLELNVQVDSLKKQIELYAKQGKLDMVLQRQNAQLKEEIQTLKVEIREAANQHRKQFEKWTEELISLRQESFRLDFAQHTEETHGKIVHRLEKECRRLKNDLEKEKNINQRLKFENQKKLTISQPIKIVEPGEEEMPSKPYDDLVKGSLNAGHFKRSSKDEFEISLVKSSKQSDQLFQDSFNSGQQFYSPNHESLSYQRSEAQIQTERCEVIQTTILSRERIQRSLNHRKNNHMKNMDQYTRIMNLSKELNEKEKTIKQLEKRFQNQKKNNESVKSKLQEKEKEIKCLKKNRSLKHGHSGQLEKGTEEIHTLKRERSHRSLQNDIHELDKKLKGIEEENQKLLTQIKQIQQQKNIVVSQNVSLTKKIKQYQAESQMVQIHEEKEQKDVILQAESQEKTEYKQKINLLDENTALKDLVEKLRQELMAKRSSQVLEKKESLIDVLLQEYPSESISIRVTKKHDEESEKSEEEEDQVTKLKGQIQILKNKLSDYEDKEAIPFEEEQQLREVIIQTDNAQPRGVQTQDKWEAMAARIQAEDKDKVNQEEVSLKEVTTNTDLLTGFLLNFGSEQKKEDSNTTEKPKNDEIESPIKIEQEIEFREVTVQVESQEDIQNKDKIIEKLKKENDQKENEVTLLKRKIEELIREKKEIKNQEKIQSQNVRESGHKAVIEEEYPEENFSIRVTQKHGEDSEASEEDEDEVSRLRGEVQLLKNRLSEMEDKEAIPFEAVEEEQELREVVVQTTESGPEEPNEWERIAAKFEAEDKAKHADGAEALKEVTGNADLLSGFLMGMISQGEGAEKREDEKQEAPEPKGGEVRTEVETLNEELQQLRNENEALMGVNRELQLKAQASGEALEEDYPEVAMNIRVSVKHDEDSELLDRAQAARLRQESEQLKERLEQLGEGEQIPFLDFAEEMKQEETRAKAFQSEQTNPREAKDSTEELHQIIKKLQDQNSSLRTELLKTKIDSSVQNNLLVQQKRVLQDLDRSILVWVSESINQLIQRVIISVESEQRQINKVVGQASLHEKDEDINLLQDCDNAYQIKSEVIHRPTIPQINAVLKQLQDLKAENKYLHELITFLKSPSSSKIQSCQQQQQDTVAQDNKDPYNQDREEVINSLTIPEEEVESSNQSKIKQKYAQKKIQFEDSQTPKFDSEGHARFDKISDDKFISSLQNKNDQTAEQLSLKNEEIASLSTKIEWLESKLYKYKKMAAKYKREHKEVEQEELLQEIEIEEEEIEFNEVETQTNPYMFDQNGSMQKYTQQLEFKLDQELKVSTNLKNKLKRWQNILKKTHQNQEFEDFEDLQIEEENIQLSQVQIQVNYPASVTSFDQRPEEEAREKMKQRGKFFLSEIENLRQKFVGEDSESVDSENYSGRNTKRSVGSDEEQRTKLSHERMLELQLSHLYKDIYSIFKTHKFKLQEEIYVDNFKETLETFISYLKREKFLTGLKYNSFEDIKEQDGDDSLIERERKASIHRIGSDMILPEIDQSKAVQQPPKVENKENNVTIPPLFIEHERAIVQSLASFELSPLFITEVSYNPLNKESHNDTVLKLTRLSSEQLSQLITLLSAQLESLRDKIAIFEEVTQETLEQLVKLCGSDNLSRLLAQL